MADGGVTDTRREIEREREALDDALNRVEARVRHDLDWRARLRSNAPRLLAVGAGIAGVVIAGAVAGKVIRNRRRRDVVERLKDVVSFDGLKAEVQDLRQELSRRRAGKPTDSEPMWTKVALKAAVAAATAAGTIGARQLVDKYDVGDPSDVHPGEVAGRAAASV